jgi:hypothetical protein
MAVARIVFGSVGPFLVPPICYVLLLIVVGRLGRSWYGAPAGWLAAALAAWDPILVTYAKQPMSDVPAALFAVISVWCLARRSRLPLLAGVAAGVSFVIRPGGLGLIAALALFAAWPRESRWRDASRFAIGLAPFVLAQALLQWRLFGSPFTTGYGSVAELYRGASVWGNLRIYIQGLWTVHSIVWWIGVLAAWLTRPRVPVALAAGALAISAIPYVLYLEFAHWETLRFLLPAIVLLSIAAAGGLVSMAARIGQGWIVAPALIGFAVVPAVQSERFLNREGVPQLMNAEARYTEVAEHLSARTAANAIVLAAQHSGSIRHYGPRMTLRWDLLRAEDFEPLMRALAEHGHPVYVVLEGTEQRRFMDGFATPLQHVHMYPFGQIRNIQIWELAR